MHRIEYSRQKSKKNDATIASINTNIARIFPKMDSRIFCRFVQGVWHSVRGSQREKLLPKNRIALYTESRVGLMDPLGFFAFSADDP